MSIQYFQHKTDVFFYYYRILIYNFRNIENVFFIYTIWLLIIFLYFNNKLM